jgi:hypothetical protein
MGEAGVGMEESVMPQGGHRGDHETLLFFNVNINIPTSMRKLTS